MNEDANDGFLLALTSFGDLFRLKKPDDSVELRKVVPVVNTLLESEFPCFSNVQVECFKKKGFIPVSEISYWLHWSNLLSKESEENWLDFPKAESIVSFLEITHQQYSSSHRGSEEEQQPTQLSVSILVVPINEYSKFLNKLSAELSYNDGTPSQKREQVIGLLDGFVGLYL